MYFYPFKATITKEFLVSAFFPSLKHVFDEL